MPESKKKAPFGPKSSSTGSKKEESLVQVIADGEAQSDSTRDLLSAPPPTSLDSTSTSTSASAPQKSPLRTVGKALLVAGVGLALAGMFVPALVAFQVHSVTLVVGGLFLFGTGALRKTLAGIRSTIDCVSNETLRLEQLALDNEGLKGNVRDVGDVAASLRGDVSSLHEQIEKLLSITSDSDFQTSIFQLAASLDQVGARLDIAMKDRFKTLEENLSKMGEKRDQASQELGDLLKEQEQMLQLVQEEYARKVEQASAETQAHIDRSLQSLEKLEHELEQHQLAVAEGLQGLSDGAQQHATQQAEGLGDLRGHVSQQLEGQVGSLHERMDGIEGRFTKIDREHAAAMGQLAERLERELSTRSEAIQESLKALEELSAQGDDEASRELERSLREQLEVLRSVVEQAARSAVESGADVGEGVTRLGERLEGIVDERFDTMTTGLTAVVECATETAANVQKLIVGQFDSYEEQESPRPSPSSDASQEVAYEAAPGAEPGPAPELQAPLEAYEPPPLPEAIYEEPQADAPAELDAPSGPFETQGPGPEPFQAPASQPFPEPPSALPQHPAPGPVEDPWSSPPQAAPYPQHGETRPDHDPLADPFGQYGDGSQNG